MSRNDKQAETESRRIIERVGMETEPSMTPSMVARARDHMAGRDAEGTDRVELWGTRIGRWLGLALLVYLIWWLIAFAMTAG